LDGDAVSVTIRSISGEGSKFITFDPNVKTLCKTGTLFIDARSSSTATVGSYTVVFELDDSN
jgi:hypothetical protein